ncbi:mechanosensitive ion channel family protein [Thiotrichales bacterium 19S3-7]|nr:mechanosensitive ion channel family protein [Thiotrichales bacterium 19S3-7]MCF6802160.1 mechanosensitive ion channel family protein [Thiotrichales bacterium 19S3-11]
MNFNKVVDNSLLPNLLHSLVALIVIAILSIFIYWTFKNKCDSEKQKVKFRSRLMYIAVCIFAISLIQIWIEGLTNIFTMLGLVAAGLVVSNKETIMNFVGFLIINWRGLFTEGDFVQIQNYTGCIDRIGILYFKLYETSELGQRQATGRKIKLPNNLVITSAISTFSPDANVMLSQLRFILDWKTDSINVLAFVEEIIQNILNDHYQTVNAYKESYVKKRNKKFAALMSLSPKVYAKLSYDKAKGLTICIDYYTYVEDAKAVETKFWQDLQKVAVKENFELIL